MRNVEREARRKLLLLQGALYRLEIVEARAALREASKPFATAKRLAGLLTFALSHKRMAFISAVVPRLLARGCSRRLARYALLIAGAWAVVWCSKVALLRGLRQR